jgi:hypothetical protein
VNILRKVLGQVQNLFGVRTWGDLRALIHYATPLVLTVLMGLNLATGNQAAAVVALIVAITSPALAALNTTSGFRTWLYGLLVPLQVFLVSFGVVSDSFATPLFAIIAAVFGSGIAVVNTNTSP